MPLKRNVKRIILFSLVTLFFGYGIQHAYQGNVLSANEIGATDQHIVTDQKTEAKDSSVRSTLSGSSKENVGEKPLISMFWAVPFILILLSIAIFPLFAPDFWHHNYWKLSLFVFGLPMIIISLFFLNDHVYKSTIHEVMNYVSFILLLASLFTISGAILVRGTLVGTPLLNTIILGIGVVLASFMATTGASMLLIRPLIRANKFRSKKVHIIIFFIFLVSNIGGLLTPLGDPPLFLGFLKGVPFLWTLKNLWLEWFITNIILLTLFFIWDSYSYKKEKANGTLQEDPANGVKEPIKIQGKIQFIFLAGVALAIYFQGYLINTVKGWPHFGPMEGGMLLMLVLSLLIAKPKSQIRKANEFTWFPIKEVAALFAGIFACMVPTLYLLELHGKNLPLETPVDFYWVTGLLSSFLDNAPTYLVFLKAAIVKLSPELAKLVPDISQLSEPETIKLLAKSKGVSPYLAAISCGAVFMGAMSYIGNAPNFMVKAIAEEQGIKMPSFFGYMIYSILILIPAFILVTVIFF